MSGSRVQVGPMGRERSGTEAAVSDAPENANEEFGRGDQEFGGGPGEVEYGEVPDEVGVDGVVADVDQARLRDAVIRTDDEREGVTLAGTDPEDLVVQDEAADLEEE